MSINIDRQYNKAILEYLIKKNFINTAEEFIKESGLSKSDAEAGDKLENKWRAIKFLNKQVEERKAKIKELEEELESGDRGGSQIKKSGESMGLPKSNASATLLGHSMEITCITFHPFYKKLVTGSADSTIKIWECEENSQEKSFKAHSGKINCIKFDPSGKILASGSNDMSIKLWNFDTESLQRTLKGHEHSVSYIEFTNDGLFLYSASRDTTIKYWEITTGYCKKTVVGDEKWVRCLSLNNSGTFLASSGDDETIVIWETGNMKKVYELYGHENISKENIITSDYFSSYSHKLIGNINQNNVNEENSDNLNLDESNKKMKEKDNLLKKKEYLLSCARDKKIILWDVQNEQIIKVFYGHNNWVRDIFEFPNGKYFVSCSDDRCVFIWDIKTGQTAKKLYNCHEKFVSCLSISPKCKLIASGSTDKTVKLWDCS